MEIFTEIVGYIAAIVGTSLMLPQVIKTLKTKNSDNVSLIMLILYFLNCLLWLSYGILIVALPVILCNFVALIISIIQIILHNRFRQRM